MIFLLPYLTHPRLSSQIGFLRHQPQFIVSLYSTQALAQSLFIQLLCALGGALAGFMVSTE